MGNRTSADYLRWMMDAAEDAAELERLYRQAMAAGEEAAFREAVATLLQGGQRTPVLTAWGYRLDLLPLEPAAEPEAGPRESRAPKKPGPGGPPLRAMPDRAGNQRAESGRSWGLALAISLGLGLLWSLLAWGQPPLPFPAASRPQFWLGWAPTAALAILGYLALAGGRSGQGRRWWLAAGALVGLAALAGGLAWGRTGDVANLTALHLPLAALLGLGLAVVTTTEGRAGAQWFPLLLKYAEVLLTAAVYVLAAGFLGVLAQGIFQVLGVQFSEETVFTVAAFVFGTIPVLAVASVYDPRALPSRQDLTQGPLRLLRLFARLALPVVIGVLAVYLFWFIPRYFWRGFVDRNLLFVYNLTVVTILGLMALAVPTEGQGAGGSRWLRWQLLLTVALTLLLNAYALAATLSRAWHFGLTPNRHAVIGWNVVTLVLLAALLLGQVRASDRDWPERFAASLVRLLPLVGTWVAWVLFATPLLW